jgi:drug/metabolite transporter, DME family
MVKSATMSGISARARQFVATGAGWGILPLLSASMLWGTSGTAQALAHLQVDPPRIGATRLLCGAAALIVIAAVTGRLRARELIAPGRRRWLVTAGVATAVYQAAFFAALSRTGVALGTLVALGSAQRSAGCSRAGSPGSRCRARGRSAPRARSPAARCWCCPTAVAGGRPVRSRTFGTGRGLLRGLHRMPEGAAGRRRRSDVGPGGHGHDRRRAAVAVPDHRRRSAGLAGGPSAGCLARARGDGGRLPAVRARPGEGACSDGGNAELAEPLTATVLAAVVLSESWTLTTAAGGLLLASGLAFSAPGSPESRLRPPRPEPMSESSLSLRRAV